MSLAKGIFGFIVSLNCQCLGCDPEMLDTVFESINEVLGGIKLLALEEN
jgi:hypothetical protein